MTFTVTLTDFRPDISFSCQCSSAANLSGFPDEARQMYEGKGFLFYKLFMKSGSGFVAYKIGECSLDVAAIVVYPTQDAFCNILIEDLVSAISNNCSALSLPLIYRNCGDIFYSYVTFMNAVFSRQNVEEKFWWKIQAQE